MDPFQRRQPASGPGRNASGTTTPPPAGLSFRIGQIVRLNSTINKVFPQGTIVKITGIVRTAFSPTVREGQSEWTRTDADSSYAFVKCTPHEQVKYFNGPKSGEEGAPRHSQLALTRRGPISVEPKYAKGTKVYIRRAEGVNFVYRGDNGERQTMLAPEGTRCFVVESTTRKAPLSSRLTSIDLDKVYYCLQVKVSRHYWQEVSCSVRKEAGNFTTIASSEARHYGNVNDLPNAGKPKVNNVKDEDVDGDTF